MYAGFVSINIYATGWRQQTMNEEGRAHAYTYVLENFASSAAMLVI